MADESEMISNFDFKKHSESAAAEYREIRSRYEDFALASKNMIYDVLQNARIKYRMCLAQSNQHH
jgi:hypothetical protein